jgi:hypothetical protein
MTDVFDTEHVYFSTFSGLRFEGDGLDLQNPLLLPATTSIVGVPAEYAHLKKQFGEMGRDWTVDVMSLAVNAHGRTVETFRLTLSNGQKVDFHFDVTDFFRS